MSRPKSAKKIFLVNRDFQLRYARAAVGVGFMTTVLSVFVVLFPLYVFNILRIPRFLPWPILIGMGSALFINIFSVFFIGIMITHRIAGPMYSIVRHLRRIGLGYFGVHMRLRQGDELRYVVRNINDMLDSLQFLTRKDLEDVDNAILALDKNDIAAARVEVESLRGRMRTRLEMREDKEGDEE